MFKQIIYVVKRVLEAILLVGAYLETFGTAVGQKGHFLRREVYAKSHCGIGRDRGENLLRKSGLTWTGSTKLLSSLLRWMSANELDTTALNP